VKSKVADINSWDLEGKKIAVVRQDIIGKNGAEMLNRLGINANFQWVRSSDELIRAMLTDVVDAGICNEWQCDKYAKQSDVQPTSIIFEKPWERSYLFFYCPP
jgi:hypothetical protein